MPTATGIVGVMLADSLSAPGFFVNALSRDLVVTVVAVVVRSQRLKLWPPLVVTVVAVRPRAGRMLLQGPTH